LVLFNNLTSLVPNHSSPTSIRNGSLITSLKLSPYKASFSVTVPHALIFFPAPLTLGMAMLLRDKGKSFNLSFNLRSHTGISLIFTLPLKTQLHLEFPSLPFWN
jgi:hypothetical protein